MIRKTLLLTLALLMLLTTSLYALEDAIEYEPRIIRGIRVWEGTIHIKGEIVLPKESKLIVKPNTKIIFYNIGAFKVFGTIQIKGEMGKEIIIDVSDKMKKQNKKFGGLILSRIPKDSIITSAVIRNANVAISATETTIPITNNVIENCRTAIEMFQGANSEIAVNLIRNCGNGIKVSMKSDPIIRKNYIKNIEKSAITVVQSSRTKILNNTISYCTDGIATSQGVKARIEGNVISYCTAGIYVYQVDREEKLIANYITNCYTAIKCAGFAKPDIIGNYIANNETGISTFHFSSPLIKNNDIIGNSTGIVAYKKANSKITKNNIIDNDIGVFCDFSSYPTISYNNFIDNTFAIKLGTFQSADWEKTVGSADIMKKEAQKRQSKANFAAVDVKDITDIVDMTKNFWGEDVTEELERKGSGENISVIYDYYDKNTVTYEGYGDKEYKLDKVDYNSWYKKLIKGCGRKETVLETKDNPMDISN